MEESFPWEDVRLGRYLVLAMRLDTTSVEHVGRALGTPKCAIQMQGKRNTNDRQLHQNASKIRFKRLTDRNCLFPIKGM